MPIPERFKLNPASPALFAKLSALCDAIEEADAVDCDRLLAQWNEHTKREYEQTEFKTYWKSIDKESFVRGALNPPPSFVDDLLYSEVVAVFEFVSSAEGEDAETSYYLDWLEAQFLGSSISDLIFWPDLWFGDSSLFRDNSGAFKPEAELSTEQSLAYAMAKSQRKLPDAPSVTLPFPLP